MDNKIFYMAAIGATSIILVSGLYFFFVPSENPDPLPKPAVQVKPNHSVTYFKENDIERQSMLEKCEVMDAAISEANCINAAEAAEELSRERSLEETRKLHGTN